VIHVDPRFSRTSALSDLFVPIRAGTDIAFLGGVIRYVPENGKWFHDYVVRYTNAPVIVTEEYQDTEDLDGLFSGFEADGRTYDFDTWQYSSGPVKAASGSREEETVQGCEDSGARSHTGTPGVRGSGRGE
jgi:formate dehydrogenase major subunit